LVVIIFENFLPCKKEIEQPSTIVLNPQEWLLDNNGYARLSDRFFTSSATPFFPSWLVRDFFLQRVWIYFWGCR
jgi:hypothetical protein